MAWRYCENCDRGLSCPDFREIIMGEVVCHCGTAEFIVDDETRSETLLAKFDELEARIVALERSITND